MDFRVAGLALEAALDDLEVGFLANAIQRLKETTDDSADTMRAPGKPTASASLRRTPGGPSSQARPSIRPKVPPPPETQTSLMSAPRPAKKRYAWKGDTYAPEHRARIESLKAKFAKAL